MASVLTSAVSARRPALCVAALLCAGVAFAQSLPTLAAPVNDFAKVISPDAAATLDQRIRTLLKATGDVVVVATVENIEGFGSIEEYAVRLFESAGIGEKDKKNGVLVVMAVAERRVRIEVGYGLEEFVTDGFAGDTIRQQMLPAFRAGDYGAGLLAGTTRVIQRIAERRGVTLENMPASEPARSTRSARQGRVPAGLIVVGIIILLAILRASSSGPSSSE